MKTKTRRQTKQNETENEGYTYCAIIGDDINVKVEGGKKTSTLMNIYGCPQWSAVLKRSGTECPHEDSTLGPTLTQTVTLWIFIVHCPKNNLLNAFDFFSSVKCVYFFLLLCTHGSVHSSYSLKVCYRMHLDTWCNKCPGTGNACCHMEYFCI